jgi:hypothetical protein
MAEPADLDLAQMLARAFDRAWDRYYLDEIGTISKETARISLAKHLVAVAREGEKDERALAASGFLHLISLTEPSPPPNAFLPAESDAPPNKDTAQPTLFYLRIDNAKAKFVQEWRVLAFSGAPLRSPIFHLRLDDAKAKFLPEWRTSTLEVSFSRLRVARG